MINLVTAWKKVLEKSLNVLIRVCFVQSITGESWVWTGEILEFIHDEINGGILKFKHLDSESRRTQTKVSYIYLSLFMIAAIDILTDDYTPDLIITCPICTTKLKSSDLIINEEGLGEEGSHTILLPVDDTEQQEFPTKLIIESKKDEEK